MSVQFDINLTSDVDPSGHEAAGASLASVIPLQRDDESVLSLQVIGDADIERFECCGVQVAALSLTEAVDVLGERAVSGLGGGVHLCNTYTLKLAHDSAEYRNLLNTDALALADGTPLTWVARKQGHANMVEPTRGPGLMDAVIRDGLAWGAKHYFYGSSPEVIELLGEILPAKYEGIEIVGLESPPFRTLDAEEKDDVRRRFADSGAHYVWVGLGTPKQDIFVNEFAEGSAAVFMAVGAAFDFAAGTVKEAPTALHGSGFEWVHRLVSEPRRLARRYMECSTLIPLLLRSAFARDQRRSVRRAQDGSADLTRVSAS